jgi:ADP-heptose:LPS heptosyltransferase
VTFPTPYASPLRGRFLVHNPTWSTFLRLADLLLAAVPRRGIAPSLGEPRRVLLALGGHLGDAVIATTAIALVRQALPAAEIGVVLGSWAKPALEGHPRLRWIHTVDHWKSNRSAASRPAKWLRYRASRAHALREIRAVGYDAAVDLYMYYPNMAGLLWRAGIPVRVGYTSGGYGPLYTHPVDWSDGEDHTAEQQARLLRVLLPALGDTLARYELPPVPEDARQRVEAVLREAGLQPSGYIVVHMGPGSRLREWPAAKWRQLAEWLTADGHRLAFTGSGDEQARRIAEVTRDVRGCVDLCNRLTWQEFVHVVACAELLVGVETVAAHVAAAVMTPCVAIWSGIGRLSHWRPRGGECTVLMSPVPCAPCFRSRGCSAMSCVRDVSVDAVLEAVHSHLRPAERDLEARWVG